MGHGLGTMQRRIVDAMRTRHAKPNDWAHPPLGGDLIGGDFVHVPSYKRHGYGYYLADGVHDMRVVALELSPGRYARGHAAMFSRALRTLEKRGVIEFPSMVPLSRDEVRIAEHLSDGLFLLDPPRYRFARLNGATTHG